MADFPFDRFETIVPDGDDFSLPPVDLPAKGSSPARANDRRPASSEKRPMPVLKNDADHSPKPSYEATTIDPSAGRAPYPDPDRMDDRRGPADRGSDRFVPGSAAATREAQFDPADPSYEPERTIPQDRDDVGDGYGAGREYRGAPTYGDLPAGRNNRPEQFRPGRMEELERPFAIDRMNGDLADIADRRDGRPTVVAEQKDERPTIVAERQEERTPVIAERRNERFADAQDRLERPVDNGSYGMPLAQPALGQMDVFADIVYCIDLTASMRPIIEKVKETACTLHQELQEVMHTNYQRSIRQLRIKVIGFRDVYCDGSFAFETSPFFCLPNDNIQFQRFVDGLEAKGGGDLPENSLEALSMAMQSDWCQTLDPSVRKRHIIVLFTDASAHPLEMAAQRAGRNYPPNMPRSYAELIDRWYGQGSLAYGADVHMDQIAKRLALFAPKGSDPWTNIAEDFDACLTSFIEPEKGGSDISTEKLLKLLGETMA